MPCPSRGAGAAAGAPLPSDSMDSPVESVAAPSELLLQLSTSTLPEHTMHAIGGQIYPMMSQYILTTPSQSQSSSSSPAMLPHHCLPGASGQYPGPPSSPFLSPYHAAYMQSFHSSAWDTIPGHMVDPATINLMMLSRSAAHLSLQSPSVSSSSFLSPSPAAAYHRPETSDESRSFVHFPGSGSTSDHHHPHRPAASSAPLFYPFAPSSRLSHPISMSSLLPPHHLLPHGPHLRHYDLPPIKSETSATADPHSHAPPPLSPLFFPDFGHRSAMHFTSCAASFGKETTAAAAPLRSPSPKSAISRSATTAAAASSTAASSSAAAHAGPVKQDDDKAALPTNQLTTCSSSLKEQKGSVMTSIENHVPAAAAAPAIAAAADAIADVPQAGIHKDESDNSSGNSCKRVAKSVSVGNDENEERQIITGSTRAAAASGREEAAGASGCSSSIGISGTATAVTVTGSTGGAGGCGSSSGGGSAALHSSLKLLKDFKIPAKHADSAQPTVTASTTAKEKIIPAPETRTIEVQCDGPDWTPVVLKSQIKNRLVNGGSEKKEKKQSEKKRKREKSVLVAVDSDAVGDDASVSVKKSRTTGTESDAMAGTTGSGKRKSGTKGAQHKLLSQKMPAVATDCDPAAASAASRTGISTDCSSQRLHCLQAETGQSQAQVLSSAHQQQQSSSPKAGSRNHQEKKQKTEKQALVKAERKKKKTTNNKKKTEHEKEKDRISGSEQQENKCERKGKANHLPLPNEPSDTLTHAPGTAPVIGDMPCPKATPKKSATVTRRRRFRSGLDMIRQPKKKKVRTTSPAAVDTTSSSNSKASQDGSERTAGLSSETRKLMANKASGETVLHRAARQGYADVLISCLESPTCDINARDFAGYTPLHECCSSGHLHIARTLLAHGADPNACAARGIRVLHDAIECDHVEIVRLLLSYGADPTICTYKGTTPLDLAQSKAMLQLLRGFLSDLNGEQKQVSQWKFSHFSSGSGRSSGFDVFSEPAPDCDPESESEEVVIEASESPLCDSFTLPVDGEAAVTVLRLSDVLTQLQVTRTEFCQRNDRLRIFSVPEQEFESKATCNQLLGWSGKRIKSETGCKVELVRLDDEIRAMLGIERTRVQR